jgi:hypothetical protein
MKKVALVTAAVMVAVILFVLATLPPKPISVTSTVDPEVQRRTIAGAYHIHSTRSDGASDKDTIAAAAARAGLNFIILTDHGDGTAQPDPPQYLHGVLCVDGVEISTNGGHYVALDMQPAPYPLGGEPFAVVEDVKRLGGFGIAAHPDSAKEQLAWNDWDAPFDGMEWLSADTEWRDESRTQLARVLFDYPLRPAPALALMLDRPAKTLERWDTLAEHRPVVAMAGNDAHGGIGRGVDEGGKRRSAFGGVPSYEASFRTFSTRVILERPPSGDASSDARQVLDAIRKGRVFTVIDAIASPGFIDFKSRDGSSSTGAMGSVLQPGRAEASVDVTMPAGGTLVLSRGAQEVELASNGPGGHYSSAFDAITGSVRVEIRVPGAPGTPPVPWLVSNPIYFLSAAPPRAAPAEGPVVRLPPGAQWHSERDSRSVARVMSAPGEVTLDYTLGAGGRNSQFAAAVADIRSHAPKFASILFSATATRPGRISVQLRYGGEVRWARSVYVDATSRDGRVPVDRLVPVDLQKGPAPDTTTADSLLFVADLTNARPGDANTIRISNLRFSR